MAELKRDITSIELIFYGVGVILGAGIYALIGKGAGLAGPALWISFVIGAIIACLTALSFAELSSMMPDASGAYMYAKEAFKNKLIPFLTSWLLAIVGATSAATVALGFAGYFNDLVGVKDFIILNIPFITISSTTIVALLLILALGWLIYRSTKNSAELNELFTIIETSGIIMIIALGIWFVIQGNPIPNLLEMPNGFSGVIGAMTLIFFAYLGFEEIVYMADDVKDPERSVPKAVLWSIVITTILYILVSIAAVTVLPWNELGQSEAPLADVASTVMGGTAGSILAVIALFSTANTVLVIILATSRIIYGLAKQRVIPTFLGNVSERRQTPYIAILVTLAIACAFAVMEDIAQTASLTDFGLFAVFLIVNLSLIKIRFSDFAEKAKFKVPFNIGKFPVLAGLGSIACFGALSSYILRFTPTGVQMVIGPSVSISAVIFAVGILVYFIFAKISNGNK